MRNYGISIVQRDTHKCLGAMAQRGERMVCVVCMPRRCVIVQRHVGEATNTNQKCEKASSGFLNPPIASPRGPLT
jgi:hypothetical protein